MSIAYRHINLIENWNCDCGCNCNCDLSKNKSTKKWSLVFFKIKHSSKCMWNSDVEIYFYESTIEYICKQINVSKILLYTYSYMTDIDSFQYLIQKHNIIIVDIYSLGQTKSIKLSIIHQLLETKENIISLDDGYGFVSNSNSNIKNYLSVINSYDYIYSTFDNISIFLKKEQSVPQFGIELLSLRSTDTDTDTDTDIGISSIYSKIKKQFGINNVINSSLMIIPFNVNNYQLIISAHNMAEKLELCDTTIITNICLTVTDHRIFKNIKDICLTDLNKILVSYLDNRQSLVSYTNYENNDNRLDTIIGKTDTIIGKLEYESCQTSLSCPQGGELSSSSSAMLITLHQFFTSVQKIHTLTEKYIKSKYVSHIQLSSLIPIKKIISYDHSDYIFYPYIDVCHSKYIDHCKYIESDLTSNLTHIAQLNYFNTNGFIPIINSSKSIYLSMYNRYNTKFSGLFIKKKISPIIIPKIMHHIWLQGDPIKNYTNIWARILRNPWKYMIWTENNLKQDVLVGVWLDLYNRIIDTTLKLLVVYMAILEKYGGIIIDSFTIPIRLVPDDFLINKFFISFMDERNTGTKLSYRIIGSIPGNKFELPDNLCKNNTHNKSIFENIKQLLINNNNHNDKLIAINKEFLSDIRITIYPSYLFNPNVYIFPKQLSNLAIMINLWKNYEPEIYTKTELKRTYNVSEKGIIASLYENPRDKLKNRK